MRKLLTSADRARLLGPTRQFADTIAWANLIAPVRPLYTNAHRLFDLDDLQGNLWHNGKQIRLLQGILARPATANYWPTEDGMVTLGMADFGPEAEQQRQPARLFKVTTVRERAAFSGLLDHPWFSDAIHFYDEIGESLVYVFRTTGDDMAKASTVDAGRWGGMVPSPDWGAYRTLQRHDPDLVREIQAEADAWAAGADAQAAAEREDDA